MLFQILLISILGLEFLLIILLSIFYFSDKTLKKFLHLPGINVVNHYITCTQKKLIKDLKAKSNSIDISTEYQSTSLKDIIKDNYSCDLAFIQNIDFDATLKFNIYKELVRHSIPRAFGFVKPVTKNTKLVSLNMSQELNKQDEVQDLDLIQNSRKIGFCLADYENRIFYEALKQGESFKTFIGEYDDIILELIKLLKNNIKSKYLAVVPDSRIETITKLEQEFAQEFQGVNLKFVPASDHILNLYNLNFILIEFADNGGLDIEQEEDYVNAAHINIDNEKSFLFANLKSYYCIYNLNSVIMCKYLNLDKPQEN